MINPELQDAARGGVLWIDEASFLSARAGRWLLEFARDSGTRLVVPGGVRQHARLCQEAAYIIWHMRPKTENLIDELRQWCDVERGRRSEVSRILNITRQAVSDWFSGKSHPNSEQTLTLIEFLENPEKFRKPGRGLGK
jgi:DNA-binding transcriptional regulator YiaG